ncbi:MAG: hypothetical protein AB1673_16965, partial [Actinomycetota bacterium]
SRPPSRPPSSPPVRAGARARLLLAAVAVPAVSVAYFASSSGFYSDDYINFREAQVNDLTLAHLTAPTSAHFGPGHVLGDWLFFNTFGLSFPWAVALMALGFAATLVALHRLLAELYRPGPGVIVLTLLYGASTVHLGVAQWWSSGLDRLPATFFTFVSLTGYLRFHRSRSWVPLAVSVLSMGAALMFYVKPALIPLYIVLLRVLVLDRGRTVSENVRAALSEWRVWAAYAVPVLAYAVVYLRVYDEGGQIYEPSVGQLGAYLWTLWFRVVTPSFFGLLLARDDTLSVALSAVAQVVLVALAVWGARRYRGAGRVYAFFAAGFLANAALIGLTRIGFFSARTTAFILFYNLEATFLAAMSVAALMRLRHQSLRAAPQPAGPPAQQPAPGRLSPEVARALVGAGAVAFVAVSLLGHRHISRPENWVGPHARAYASTTAAALDRLVTRFPTTALVDSVVPDVAVFPRAGPYVSYSEVLPVIDDRVEFDTRDRALMYLGHDGALVPVAFDPALGGDAVTMFAMGALTVDKAIPASTPEGVCVSALSQGAVISYTPPFAISGAPLFVAMRYSSTTRELFGFLTEPAGGGGIHQRFAMWAPKPDHATVIDLSAPSAQKLYIVMLPGSQVCLKSLELGHLVPR